MNEPVELHHYAGADATVTWNASRCIHAAECVRRAPSAFDPSARPWIRPDAATVDALAEAVDRCPSGALELQDATGASMIATPPANTGVVIANGPIHLRGNMNLHLGRRVEQITRMALCRCGASQRKPFCDNSHNKIGFVDPGRARFDTRPTGDGNLTTPLDITLIYHGPAKCTGPLTLQASDGGTMFSDPTFLCRCGGSRKKPYCDGTHTQNGFAG